MVGHLLQYHPVFRRLMSMTAEGRLGRIDYIYSHRLNLGKIRREENVLWSFAPHDISMILALAGQEPDRIAAFAHAPLDAKIADIAIAHLHFPTGMRAHLFVSWLNPFKEQKLTVIGGEAMAVFDDGQPWENKLILYPGGVTWRDGSPVADKTAGEAIAVPQSEPLGAEIDHFLDCVATRARPRTDAAEAIRVLSVLNRAETAIAEAGR
jgi:UDP-2-acetamido-3-amino-2,3-dideoxy-glucuronate N-acetyltransferase